MSNSLEILNSDGQCGIFNPYFLIYGSLVAFFVPFIIMLVTYTLTIRLLSKRARMLKSMWNEACMVRSVGRKKSRPRSRKWVSLTSTTESSTDNETLNSTRLHRTVKRSRIVHGFSKMSHEVGRITCVVILKLFSFKNIAGVCQPLRCWYVRVNNITLGVFLSLMHIFNAVCAFCKAEG